MTGLCVRHSEIPGSSRLFVDFLYNFERVKDFYAHDPSKLESISRAISEIEYPEERRKAVVEALRVTNGESAALELLAKPGTVAILTGQQVGLYGGPAYTLYKALSAVRLAKELNASGQAAVAIFWLATEDHDVEEIRGAQFWDGGVEAVAESDGRPAGLHSLARLPEELPLAEPIAAMARRHYQNGRSFGEAFLGLAKELLAPYGVLFADPLEPRLREAGKSFLEGAARREPELSAAIVERNAELKAAGYQAQVHFEANETSLFFLLDDGQRKQLKLHTSDFDGKALAGHGTALSPNALLRPVWQDWLFPTAALIGGPGELAYFAQSEVLYQRLLGRMPVVLPRAFFTLVDEQSAKTVERYRVRFADMLQGEEQVRLTLAKRLVPPSLTQTLSDAEKSVQKALGALAEQLDAFDPSLAQALENSQRKIRYQFSKNQSKIVLEMLRKNEQAQRHAAHISHRLAPHGHLQERHYSMLALLSDYGLDLIPALLENIHYGCHDHHVLLLG